MESRPTFLQIMCLWLIPSSSVPQFTPHVVATKNPSTCWLPVVIAVVSGNLKVLREGLV